MESETSNQNKVSDQSFTKWIVTASLLTFVVLITFLFIGLKSQYVEVDFCILTVNCSQAAKQVTDNAHPMNITESPLEDIVSNSKPIKITVKPLGVGTVAGVTSAATIAALIGLGFISLPIEFALVIGALIGSGTFFALKTLY